MANNAAMNIDEHMSLWYGWAQNHKVVLLDLEEGYFLIF